MFSYLLLWIRCIRQLLSSQNNILYLLFCRQHQSFFVRSIHDSHLILVCNQFTSSIVHLLQRYLTIEAACQFQLLVNRDEWFAIQKMLDAGCHKLRVSTIVTLTILTFIVVQTHALGTLQLRLSETMLANTLRNTYCSDDTSQDIVFLTADRQGERLLHTAEEERCRTTCSTLIGRISL